MGNEIVMRIEDGGKLPKDWILLDNQSKVDVFCNKKLLTNIREHSKTLDIHCNAGVTSTNLIGKLRGYGTVWYNPTGIANILSLAKATDHGYHVTFDRTEGNHVTMLPFKLIPARIIIKLIHYCVFWLNSFPAKNGISDVLSPHAIVVGATVDYHNHCKIEFGTYVQTHEQHDNTMIPRTIGAIALRPSGNSQGGR